MAKKNKTIDVKGTGITVFSEDEHDFISLTDLLKAKDGDFFISDWLRNRNTVEYLGIWEKIHNPDFNYGEFATIKSQAGLKSSIRRLYSRCVYWLKITLKKIWINNE